jgi:hypothetical protein
VGVRSKGKKWHGGVAREIVVGNFGSLQRSAENKYSTMRFVISASDGQIIDYKPKLVQNVTV